MKLRTLIKSQKPTADMIDNFINRTAKHIELVRKNLNYFIEYYENLKNSNKFMILDLINRSKIHDASKYQEPEYTPYLWITEYNKCKNLNIPFEYPPGIKVETEQATWHHIHTNSHHPEYHKDINNMPLIDIIEMVCDWTAMAEELGQGTSAKSWADKTIGHRWKFDENTTNLIYQQIELLDKLKS